MAASRYTFGASPVIVKDQGTGILIDPASPDYGWADIIGELRPDPLGANAPALSAFRGGLVRCYAYSATDKMDMEFHIPHDYAMGTDLYLHVHWGHNGTAISGSLILDYGVTYGQRDGTFAAEITPTQTISTPDIATIPRYGHRVDEFQLSAASPSATQLDSDDIEVDGLVMVNLTVDTIPTITGGSPNEPYIFFCDIHYQTTGLMGTKQKASPFWT